MEEQAPVRDLPVTARISRRVVQVHHHFYGRGPTKAKTVLHDDVLVVVLEDLFTTAERTLVEAGAFAQVRETRQVFQDQVAPVLRQAIEEETGRDVAAFMSQVSPENVAVEVFILGGSTE